MCGNNNYTPPNNDTTPHMVAPDVGCEAQESCCCCCCTVMVWREGK